MKRNIFIVIISVLILTCLLAYARTTTTDLGLVKPTWEEEDPEYDILVDINANMDSIEVFANDVFRFDSSPVLRANLDIDTFNIEGVDATEFGYLDGVTSDIQTQFGLRYLKTEVNTVGKVEAIYGKDIIDSVELDAFGYTDSGELEAFGYVDSGELEAFGYVDSGELEALDYTDSGELVVALADYYPKIAIDELSEVEVIYGEDIIDSNELEAFDYIDSGELDNLDYIDSGELEAKDYIDSGELDAFTGQENIVTVGTIITGTWEGTAIADGYIPDGITIDLSALATTFTCIDNEDSAETIFVVFVDGATGAQGAETDGDFTYNPSTGTLTATTHAGVGGELTVFGSVYSLDDTFEAGLRNGIYSGVTVTDSAELTIHWTEGVAYVDGSIFAVNADTDETIADNDTTYLYILKDNATMQESTTEPTIGLVGEFALVCVLYTYDNDIHEKFDYPLMTGNLRYEIWKFLDDITPTATVGGCNTAIDTEAALANDFTIATGKYYVDVFDLNTISSILYSSTSDHNANNLTAFFHESSSWVDSPENGVNFSYWDDGADKSATAANQWYTAWIYVEDGDKIIYVYPQTEHANEAAALVEGAVYPPSHQGIILPSAKFVFRHGVSAFGATAYFIDIRPFFGYSDGGSTVQMIYQTVTGDSGSTTATASDDSLAIVGGGIVQTAVTADTVTVTATEVDSVVGAVTGIIKADGGGNIGGISIGTAEYALTVDSAETGYDWTLLAEVVVNSTTLADGEYQAIRLDNWAVGETVVYGQLVFLNFSDKEWYLADASDSTEVPALGIALESKDSGETCKILREGYIRDNDWNFTAWMVYLSDSPAGGVLSTPPGDTGDQIQRVGDAVSANIMYFNPSIDVGEI